MPSISYDGLAAWSNYHLTLGSTKGGDPVPSMTIESLGRVHAADVSGLSGLERFAATGKVLLDHVKKVAANPRADFAAGTCGRGWTFSPLIGTPVSQLQCDGLAGTGALDKADRHSRCSVPADRIALTSGGTRLRELVQWAERRNATIRTSGTHLGATIAGAAATASHGSRLGFGGIQDMILGMHLIVGERDHVWIQRKSRPVLKRNACRKLEIDGACLQVVSDDDKFEDALVHLGGMGIVNGLAVGLVPNNAFALLMRQDHLDAAWLDTIGERGFSKIAKRLKCKARPQFYEVTLNPHAPFTDMATHMMYFLRRSAPLLPPGNADIVRPADAISQLGTALAHYIATLPGVGRLDDSLHNPGDGSGTDPTVAQTLGMLLDGHTSAFSYYRAKGKFQPNSGAFDPDGPGVPGFYWSGLHSDEITGDIPGALYNASYAIPLECVHAAVKAICEAVSELEPSFVFTLRFVEAASGTLAFTRFTDCAVIEIDGLSPLICDIAAMRLPPDLPNGGEIKAALAKLRRTLPTGADAVRDALDEAKIPFSMHWAKLGGLNKARVYANFGHPQDEESLIRRWRATRDSLLSHEGRRLFWNDHLVTLGIIDPP